MLFHPFHIVNQSPWPITGATSAFMLTTGLVNFMTKTKMNLLMMSLVMLMLVMYQWWRDTSREATMQGHHTLMVKTGMKWGMMLFILSEVMFFFSFFWGFFHMSLSPDHELGALWPPTSILPFNPYYTPLLNTTILLSSGATVTWAHHSLLKGKYFMTLLSLFLTCVLGIYFSTLQSLEYWESTFSISDSVYGSSFFISTGFHGLHVLIGTTFLTMNLLRMLMGHMSKQHHFSFEAAAWYWHFVDVVWIFLYTFVYWWSF